MKIPSNLWCFQWFFFLKTRILDYSSVGTSFDKLQRHHCHWESRCTDQHRLGLMIFFSCCAKARCRAQLLPVLRANWGKLGDSSAAPVLSGFAVSTEQWQLTSVGFMRTLCITALALELLPQSIPGGWYWPLFSSFMKLKDFKKTFLRFMRNMQSLCFCVRYRCINIYSKWCQSLTQQLTKPELHLNATHSGDRKHSSFINIVTCTVSVSVRVPWVCMCRFIKRVISHMSITGCLQGWKRPFTDAHNVTTICLVTMQLEFWT